MPHDSVRLVPVRLGRISALVTLLAACAAEPAGREVSLSGDVPGLDSLAARGDSLIARTERGDVLDAPIADRPTPSSPPPAPPPAPPASPPQRLADAIDPGGDPGRPSVDAPVAPADPRSQATRMMERAKARADSMAQAGAAGRPRAAQAGDTVRGVLVPSMDGSGARVALRAEGRLIQLSGVGTTGLTPLNGTEVVLRGVRVTPRDLVVTDFLVRGWNGLPAVDGIILADGSLRATDGSGVIRGVVPPLLRGRTGARAWIALRGGQPVQFDLIER